jgi:hypothetical protein
VSHAGADQVIAAVDLLLELRALVPDEADLTEVFAQAAAVSPQLPAAWQEATGEEYLSEL